MTQSVELVRTCAVDDCDKKPAGRGLCRTHYTRWRRGVSLDTPIREYKTFDDPDGFRTCSDCEKTKPLDDFYNVPNSSAKRRKCKSCLIGKQ